MEPPKRAEVLLPPTCVMGDAMEIAIVRCVRDEAVVFSSSVLSLSLFSASPLLLPALALRRRPVSCALYLSPCWLIMLGFSSAHRAARGSLGSLRHPPLHSCRPRVNTPPSLARLRLLRSPRCLPHRPAVLRLRSARREQWAHRIRGGTCRFLTRSSQFHTRLLWLSRYRPSLLLRPAHALSLESRDLRL